MLLEEKSSRYTLTKVVEL